MDELLKRITVDPKVMVGKPTIKGTRITVEHVTRRLAAGWTEAELLDAHPHLMPEDIRAACSYAATNV
jgi:uncharacterized protein (DUF433 family)